MNWRKIRRGEYKCGEYRVVSSARDCKTAIRPLGWSGWMGEAILVTGTTKKKVVDVVEQIASRHAQEAAMEQQARQWHVSTDERNEQATVVDANGELVAVVCHGHNANFIAAAPKLFAAAEKAIAAITMPSMDIGDEALALLAEAVAAAKDGAP